MTERKKDILFCALLLAVLILFYSKILFTAKIIRAPDITNEFYWGIRGFWEGGLLEQFKIHLQASWNLFANSGATNEGGTESGQFLVYQRLLFNLIPPPASVAWFIVLQLFFGGAGTYCYCRAIGASRPASLLGGLIFAVAPENASLINAGHVMKIATISFAPWAFYFFEKGCGSRRLIFFLAAGFVLAFQFFNLHWQISYYTCLGMAVYGLARSVWMIREDTHKGISSISRVIGLNLVVLVFFLTTVAISLAPLANWSKDTNRGVNSGANQGKGGLERDEAMSWSLPPEEIATLVIPGLFGLSRQEGGENPTNIDSYYWGRMHFTQTSDYMGLLPWLLLPLPLIFRRDKFTWLALTAVVGGIIFSMGKYSTIYTLLFDYFPGINRFRVPKMMMFISLLGVAVLACRGLDLLFEEEVRKARAFSRYLLALLALPAVLALLLAVEVAGREYGMKAFMEVLAQPTRYEEGLYLVVQRWNNLATETGIAALVAAAHAIVIWLAVKRRFSARTLGVLLIMLFLADVGRINNKFLFLVNEPEKARGVKTPVMEFLLKDSRQYRVLPMDGSDPMQYASNKIPVMFTSNPVQLRRWQEFLDVFDINSALPDMLNVKYLVYSSEQYEKEKDKLSPKYQPVFVSPDKSQVVLVNQAVMPKAWLVPSVLVAADTIQRLSGLTNAAFDPARIALVESGPLLPLQNPSLQVPPPGDVAVSQYEGEQMTLQARVNYNSLLVLGEKYYRGWQAYVDGKRSEIVPVNHVLRGVYLTAGEHRVEFRFDPLPFKIGKYLTLASMFFFAVMLLREWYVSRQARRRNAV